MGKIWEVAIWHSTTFKSGCSPDIGFGLHMEIIEKDEIDRQSRIQIKNDIESKARKFGLWSISNAGAGSQVT